MRVLLVRRSAGKAAGQHECKLTTFSKAAMTSYWTATLSAAGCHASRATAASPCFGGAEGGCIAWTRTRRHRGTRALLATTMWISSRNRAVLTPCSERQSSARTQ